MPCFLWKEGLKLVNYCLWNIGQAHIVEIVAADVGSNCHSLVFAGLVDI